jgi:hypothetical protein
MSSGGKQPGSDGHGTDFTLKHAPKNERAERIMTVGAPFLGSDGMIEHKRRIYKAARVGNIAVKLLYTYQCPGDFTITPPKKHQT